MTCSFTFPESAGKKVTDIFLANSRNPGSAKTNDISPKLMTGLRVRELCWRIVSLSPPPPHPLQEVQAALGHILLPRSMFTRGASRAGTYSSAMLTDALPLRSFPD